MLGYNTRDGAASSNASDHFRLIQAFVLTKMEVSRYERTLGSDLKQMLGPVEPLKRKP